jgi:DNA-binding winged helix-turn-helix (wHTH) protein/tetratricopeptide (TPR) repeat protein
VRYLFADCSLDIDRRELRRGTEVVPVEPQVFDVLVHLLENRERVVSKDDLLAAIWQGRIVSESALNTRISAARSAIGDNGEDQRLIKTLPRKGLRFVGAVREEQQLRSADHAMPPNGGRGEASSVKLGGNRPDRAPKPVHARTRWHALTVRGLRIRRRLRELLSHRPLMWSLATLVTMCAVLATLVVGAANRQQPKLAPLNWIAHSKLPSSSLSITLGVLPFTTSMLEDISGSLIAERIGHGVRGYLSRNSVLHIISREAAQDIAATTPSTWSKSGLRYVVRGEMDGHDGELRLRVDLTDAATHLQVWSKAFQYSTGEWRLRQDEVARQLAYAVHVETIRREGSGLPDAIAETSVPQLLAGGWAVLMGSGVLRLEQAALLFGEALRRNPECTSAMVGLAGAKLLATSNARGDRPSQTAESEALLRKALVRGTTDFTAYFYLGILHNLEGNVPAALQAYDRALEINPTFAPAYAYRGRALIRLGRYEEALRGIEQAYRVAGKVVSGWQLWQGIAQLQLGQDQAAGESFRKALAVLPDNPYAHAALASFHGLYSEWEVSSLYVDKLRRRTPNMTDQWRLVEFNRGLNDEPLTGRLGDGLRLALEAQPLSQ